MEWLASEGMQGVAAFCSLNFSNILRMIRSSKVETIYYSHYTVRKYIEKSLI